MNVCETTSVTPYWESVQKPKKSIQVQIYPEPCAPEFIVDKLLIKGPIDIYFWYEGSKCLPKLGAAFMKENFFEPFYRLKPDAKLCLYSLRAWDFKKTIKNMQPSTPIGEAINRINTAAIECFSSSSFFKYCAGVQEGSLYKFINTELSINEEQMPQEQKKWLFALSAEERDRKMTVTKLFNNQPSLLDCIQNLDVAKAYSPMQYVEGYYLIQDSVKRALSKGQKKIQIAFVLPNDESKYYLDYPKDIKAMLRMDFGKYLSDVDINITFRFFVYGDSLKSRPYIDRRAQAPQVDAEEIPSYFDYLSQQSAAVTKSRKSEQTLQEASTSKVCAFAVSSEEKKEQDGKY